MTAYVPFFSFSVSHRYFGGGCMPLDFVPSSATQAVMRNLDLLLRTEAAGFTLFCRDGDLADLKKPGTPALQFKVFPRDRNFARYTIPLASPRGEMLVFDGVDAVHILGDDSGRYRLHAAQSVTEADFRAWNSPLVQAVVTARDAVMPPAMIVSLPLSGGRDEKESAPAYYVEFESYASYWKYYFLGDIAKRDLAISDVSGQVEFTSLGMTDVVSGRALAFMSSSAIPMQATPPQRFQLLENGAMGEKVLIKRLPNAAIGQVSREEIRQQAALVSEMYIN